jgi:hypothetical protein
MIDLGEGMRSMWLVPPPSGYIGKYISVIGMRRWIKELYLAKEISSSSVSCKNESLKRFLACLYQGPICLSR